MILRRLTVAIYFCAGILAANASGEQLTQLFASQQLTDLFASKMLDPASGRVLSNVLVSIRAGRIESVNENAPRPSPTDTAVVLPGLTDRHTHMLLQPEDAITPPVLHKSQAYRAVEAAAAARRTLEAGFTSVRDMDSEGADFADVAVRDAITRGVTPRRRTFVSGNPLTITGGYMNLLGFNPDLSLADPGVPTDTPAAMIATIRRDVKYGVDQIKIYVTGSLPQVAADFQPLSHMSLEHVKLIAAEAPRFHKDAAAHAYGGMGARNAIEGGVRSIEHGLFLDEDTIQLMKKHGTFFCPTLYLYTSESGLDRNGAAFMQHIRDLHKESFQMAYKAGVKIVFGTDADGFTHGDNASEFQFTTDFGMSPLDAIRSSPTVTAELLRKERTWEPSRLAALPT